MKQISILINEKVKVIVKSKPCSIMKDYIALHWLVPKSEMRDFHHKIPKNQIWMRDNIYNDTIKRNITLYKHELPELELMINKGMKYKPAHARAEMADGFW